jgi:lauroyl/myristoyl acyltransferase
LKPFLEGILCGAARLAERSLPLFLLWILLWPAAAVLAARDGRRFSGLSPSLRRRIGRQRVPLNMAKFLMLWPDRLRRPRWQRRCRYTGLEEVERLRARNQPLILVGLHYGLFRLLYHWLRARGWEVAALVGGLSVRPRYRWRLDRLLNRANGLADVPHFFAPDRLWDLLDFLRPNRVLLIAIDGEYGARLPIRGDGYCLRLAPGVFRLAALAHAAVVPCLATATPRFGLSIHFGKPVPSPLIVDRSRRAAACAFALEECYPVVQAHPEQCEAGLLPCFAALVSRLEAEVSHARGVPAQA